MLSKATKNHCDCWLIHLNWKFSSFIVVYMKYWVVLENSKTVFDRIRFWDFSSNREYSAMFLEFINTHTQNNQWTDSNFINVKFCMLCMINVCIIFQFVSGHVIVIYLLFLLTWLACCIAFEILFQDFYIRRWYFTKPVTSLSKI